MAMDHTTEFKMAEIEPSDSSTSKSIRQSISVPFIWEVRPGTPKKDWKHTAPPTKPIAPPLKLIASVPFEWEEKPGKPLPCFSQASSPLPESNSFLLSSATQSQGNGNDWGGITDQDRDETETLESYTETCESETDDSFISAPSLLANGLIPSTALSCAVPVQQNSLKDMNSRQLTTPGSPGYETDSSTSSYATGTTSLVGASFLEWLFPLLPPRSSFLETAGCSEIGVSQIQAEKQIKDFDRERNNSASIRRPLTLGELIMMSRRQSYIRKATQIPTQNLSKEIMKKNAFGCDIFGTSNILRKFHINLKRHLQLKLM